MEELRSRFDSTASDISVSRSSRSGFQRAKVPYLLQTSVAWLALRGYHVWCMLVGLCITVLLLLEVFLNEYVQLFSNPWVVGSKAESFCIAAASLVSVLLLSWSSHICHTGVLLILDAARDDSFLVFRSLFCLASLNSRTGMPVSGSVRAGQPLWKWIDVIVQILIYGSLDLLPVLVALLSRHPVDWLTCVAWVAFAQIFIFWILVCVNDYVAKIGALRELCAAHPPSLQECWRSIPHCWGSLRARARTASTMSPLVAASVRPKSARCGCDSLRCSMQALWSTEGEIIEYENWQTHLENFMAGRRWEDYVLEDRQGTLVELGELVEDSFPLRVLRLADAPTPNLCLLWCEWLHRQPSRCACCVIVVLGFAAVMAIYLREMVLLALLAVLFFFCILHLLRKHCVMGRSLERIVTLKTEEERLRLLEALDSELRLTQAVKVCHADLPSGCQLVDDVGRGFSGMEAYLRRSSTCPIAVRLQPLEPWSVYWETFCGCSPDHIIQGCLLYMACGGVICLVLFYTRYILEGFWGLLLLAVLAVPAMGLTAFPEHARVSHVAISLFVALLALIFTVLATHTAWLLGRTLVLCVCSQCLLPRKLHSLRRISLCFTVLLTLLLGSLISVSLSALVKGDLMAPPLSKSTFHFPQRGRMDVWGAENFTAASCTMGYGTTDEEVVLELADFGLFNKLVYMPEKPLRKHNREWLPQWELTKQQRRERRCLPSDGACDAGDWTSWFVFSGRKGTKLENTSVITIRGTKTPLDYILDLDLWSGALMQQVFSNFLLTGPPVSAFLQSSLARHWFKGKKVHYASVWEYLHRQHLQHHPEKLIYLTGHSLGGGIANLLGAEFGIPSIAFSPPGVHSTATLLEIDPVRLQALALDVIPDKDPVVRTGDHGTVQLPIACADHWPMCHRIFNSVCELLDTCGDQAVPPRELPCDFCPAKLRQRPELAPHCRAH